MPRWLTCSTAVRKVAGSIPAQQRAYSQRNNLQLELSHLIYTGIQAKVLIGKLSKRIAVTTMVIATILQAILLTNTPVRPSLCPYNVLNSYILENADSRRKDATDF